MHMRSAGKIKLTWVTLAEKQHHSNDRPPRVIVIDADCPRRWDRVLMLQERAIAQGFTPFVVYRYRTDPAKRRTSKRRNSSAR